MKIITANLRKNAKIEVFLSFVCGVIVATYFVNFVKRRLSQAVTFVMDLKQKTYKPKLYAYESHQKSLCAVDVAFEKEHSR